MTFKNVEALNDTIKRFMEYVDNVVKSETLADVDKNERAAVDALRLAQVQVEMAGRDLYAAATNSRQLIRLGKVNNENDKPSEPVGGKRKSTRKAK